MQEVWEFGGLGEAVCCRVSHFWEDLCPRVMSHQAPSVEFTKAEVGTTAVDEGGVSVRRPQTLGRALGLRTWDAHIYTVWVVLFVF